jgi:hypothetical protein
MFLVCCKTTVANVVLFSLIVEMIGSETTYYWKIDTLLTELTMERLFKHCVALK